MSENNNEPKFRQTIDGKIKEIQGKVQAAQADRAGDPAKKLEALRQQVTGKVEAEAGRAAGDAIAAAERLSAAGVLEGQRHRLHGTGLELAGKAQAGLGKLADDAAKEAEGLAKQVAGRIEKAAGRVEEAAAKLALHDAVKADAEYMKPR